MWQYSRRPWCKIFSSLLEEITSTMNVDLMNSVKMMKSVLWLYLKESKNIELRWSFQIYSTPPSVIIGAFLNKIWLGMSQKNYVMSKIALTTEEDKTLPRMENSASHGVTFILSLTGGEKLFIITVEITS